MKHCVIAPHLDDETFGCGVLLLDLKQQKKKIYLVVVGKCDTSKLKKINSFYGFEKIITLKVDPTDFGKIGSVHETIKEQR